MDEPTTHLDLSSIDALAYALDQFKGTLVFISHDVYFIRALANHVVHVNAGQLTHYPGGYQYYLDKSKAQSERAGLTATGRAGGLDGKNSQGSRGRSPSGVGSSAGAAGDLSSAASRKDQKRVEARQRQARSHERRAQQQIVHELEREIQALEVRQAEMVAELEQQETYEKPGRAQAINRELVEVQQRLAELNPQWEQQATRLGTME
jgi:ATP-binding cassette, subfamily F, member 3